VPSTAANQLDMWGAGTFDPETIDRELRWAAGLGFNSVRVFLHDLPWRQDADAFLARVDRFLAIAASHGIGTMLVLLDGCWHPEPGSSPVPTPHVHNSCWVQCPGVAVLRDRARHAEMADYVRGVIARFRTDPRVHAWDLFNEADNSGVYADRDIPNKQDMVLLLMRDAFEWARAVDPAQPLTAPAWRPDWLDPDALSPVDRFALETSDVVSFHTYNSPERVVRQLAALRRYGRPLLCTEYLARTTGNTVAAIAPLLAREGVGAWNWGLVAGRTQTQYPWDSWRTTYTAEPELWLHDLLRPDGTPFDPAEVEVIRALADGHAGARAGRRG
jgi:hypothetical protein